MDVMPQVVVIESNCFNVFLVGIQKMKKGFKSKCMIFFFSSIFLLILNWEDVQKDKQMEPLSLKIVNVLILLFC